MSAQTYTDLRCYRGDVFRVALSKTALGWFKIARVTEDGPSGAELIPATHDTAGFINRTLNARGHTLTPKSLRELRAFVSISEPTHENKH